ncbi:hypothetical protein ABZP36_004434 [Zizania latifolia]
MSQEGGNLPQDAQEIHGHTASTITTDTPVGPAKMSCSNSSSSSGKTLVTGDENNNAVSKPAASLEVTGDVAETEGKGKSVDEGEGGGAGDGSNNGTCSESKSKSSSDGEGDDELRDVVAAATGGGSGDVKVKDAAVVHALHVWTERERRKKMKTMFHRLQTLLPRLPEKSDKVTIVDEAISYIKALQGAIQRLERLKMERALEQQLAAAAANAGEGSTPAPPPAGAAMTTPPPLPVITREATLADLVHGWNNAAQDAAAGGSQQLAASGARAPAVMPPPLQTWSGRNMTVSITGNDAFLTLSLPRRQDLVTTVLSVLEKHHIDVVTATVMTEQDCCLFSLHVQLDPAGCSSETLTSEDKYKLAVSELMLWLSN